MALPFSAIFSGYILETYDLVLWVSFRGGTYNSVSSFLYFLRRKAKDEKQQTTE